ncbi:hypothetical protein VNI00_015336 [Paramarasmius palmivorus]|uniref:Indoleamine 2,3-dioxygenase n=1 Tax=Paramarasmius palmivorus TaxID=297713 RepID=A0AAW0BK94_9AGAR
MSAHLGDNSKPLTWMQSTAFDVDPRSGFMPPEVPLQRLPADWAPWEVLLDEAIKDRLVPGDRIGISAEEEDRSARWRARVQAMPLLPTAELLKDDEPTLSRRAHLVLAFLQSFYVQTLSAGSPVCIPKPIAVPLLHVSKFIGMPPVITYADCVLYNWNIATPLSGISHPVSSSSSTPACIDPEAICSQTLFTGLPDEETFYLTSAKIEVRGVEALDLMRSTMDELFVSDAIAVERITKLLERLSAVIGDLRGLLMDVRKGCDPEIYYNSVRPFFRGEDGSHEERKWVFEGIEEYPELANSDITKELSGASAAQSTMIYALDVFLGLDDARSSSFMARQQIYMPRNHRLFLDHLGSSSRPLRQFVSQRKAQGMSEDIALVQAYNSAVKALKEFRDGHMIIATLYIVSPARRARNALHDHAEMMKQKEKSLKGTGGTEMVKFLKGVRDNTKDSMLAVQS